MLIEDNCVSFPPGKLVYNLSSDCFASYLTEFQVILIPTHLLIFSSNIAIIFLFPPRIFLISGLFSPMIWPVHALILMFFFISVFFYFSCSNNSLFVFFVISEEHSVLKYFHIFLTFFFLFLFNVCAFAILLIYLELTNIAKIV